MPAKSKQDAKQICGAKTRSSGEPCKLAKGFGTDHPGYGRCKYHGGATPSGKKAAATEAATQHTPVEELLKDQGLEQLIKTLKRRGDITDLSEELALARAVVLDFINRAAELEAALLRWSASWDKDWQAGVLHLTEELGIAYADEDWDRYAKLFAQVPDPLTFMQRPTKVHDLSDSVRMLKDVAGIVDTMVRHQAAGSIPATDVETLLVEIANVVERTVRDHVGDVSARAGLIASLERAFAEIRIPTWEASGDGIGTPGSGRGLDA